MSTSPRRAKRQGAKCYRVCIKCDTRRQIPWHLRLADDHQDDTYICKFCKPAKRLGPRGERYFDQAAYARAWSLHRRYSITVEQYDQMLAEQGGLCRICGKPPAKNRLHVDHDRSCCPGSNACGKCIRGLLCVRCNSRLEWWMTFQAEIANYLKVAVSA